MGAVLLIDDELLELLNRSKPVWWDTLLEPLTSHGVLIGIGIAATLWVALKSRSQWKGAVALALSVVISDLLAAHVLPPMFERPRPCAKIELMANARQGCPPGWSMPSRHAAAAGAGAVAFSAAAPVLSGLAAALAVLIGASRVWLGESFATDVLAGYLLGAVVAAALLSLPQLRFLGRKSW